MANQNVQKEVEIEKIKTGNNNNPRGTIGDVTDLVASISVRGILRPLIVDEKMQLIAGHRRLAAAKAVGLKTVPVTIRKGDTLADLAAIALIDNIQHEDLSPMDEAKAFSESLAQQFYKNEEALAKAIGKKTGYVTRRLALLQLVPDVQEALHEGKIQLGHALILSKMEEKMQVPNLKEILGDKLSVGSFIATVTENNYGRKTNPAADLRHACFDTSKKYPEGCQNCPQNGAQQAILDETGFSMKGVCMGPTCFAKKTHEWIQKQEKALASKGITVLSAEQIKTGRNRDYNDPARFEEIDTWADDYKAIAKTRLQAEPDVFGVSFALGNNGKVERQVFCMQLKKRKPAKTATTSTNKKPTQEVDEETEKALNLSRKEKFQTRMAEFKRHLLIGKTQEIIDKDKKQDTVPVKALALYALIKNKEVEEAEALEKIIKEETKVKITGTNMYGEISLPGIFKLSEKELDRLIARVAGLYVSDMDDEDLTLAAEKMGFSMEKHFEITEDFLELHTTDQLKALAKELGIDVELCATKAEHMGTILKADTKGRVPKALED